MQAAHAHSIHQYRSGLAEIPESWSKAYTHRRRRLLLARLALWGVALALAIAVLIMSGRAVG